MDPDGRPAASGGRSPGPGPDDRHDHPPAPGPASPARLGRPPSDRLLRTGRPPFPTPGLHRPSPDRTRAHLSHPYRPRSGTFGRWPGRPSKRTVGALYRAGEEPKLVIDDRALGRPPALSCRAVPGWRAAAWARSHRDVPAPLVTCRRPHGRTSDAAPTSPRPNSRRATSPTLARPRCLGGRRRPRTTHRRPTPGPARTPRPGPTTMPSRRPTSTTEIAFTPGGRVTVPFTPRGRRRLDGRRGAPRALPPAMRPGPHGRPAGRDPSGPRPRADRSPGRAVGSPGPGPSHRAPADRERPAGRPVAGERHGRERPSTQAAPGATDLRRQVFGFLPYWTLGDRTTGLNYDLLSTIAYFSVGADRPATCSSAIANGSPSTGWGGWTSTRHDQRHQRRPPRTTRGSS